MAEQQPRMSRPHPLWTIDGLGAEGPFPDFKEKLALFGQFVGDWVIEEARYPRPHGLELRSQGEIHFGWILDGRAVQDVFMTRDPDTGRAVPVGLEPQSQFVGFWPVALSDRSAMRPRFASPHGWNSLRCLDGRFTSVRLETSWLPWPHAFPAAAAAWKFLTM